MDEDCQKLLQEKDAVIKELQEKIKELEMKIRSYEIREIYRGILPDEVLEELVKLPPEQMVIEIGKYLRERGSAEKAATKAAVESEEKISKVKEDISEVEKEVTKAESEVDRAIGAITGRVMAKVGVDLNFTQKYDYDGSDVAFLAEDIMRAIGVKEGGYVTVRKDGVVNLRVMPYSKDGFIVIPTWVRERIGAKVNDFVEVVRK